MKRNCFKIYLIFICVVSVNTKDLTAPSITCPANIGLDAESDLGTVTTWNDADFSVADNVSGAPDISVSCLPANNTRFAIDTTTVNCTATDLAANESEDCQFNVTVAGNNHHIFIRILFFFFFLVVHSFVFVPVKGLLKNIFKFWYSLNI
jgi:hypothetical protein